MTKQAKAVGRKNGHVSREIKKVSSEIVELEQRVSNLTGMMAQLDTERARCLMRIHILRSEVK